MSKGVVSRNVGRRSNMQRNREMVEARLAGQHGDGALERWRRLVHIPADGPD